MDKKCVIDLEEAQKVILEFIGSDEYNRMINNTIGANNNDFKAGAMWGLAIAGMLISTKTNQYCVHKIDIDLNNLATDLNNLANEVEDKMMHMCGCRNCIETVKAIIKGEVPPIELQCNECKITDCDLKHEDDKKEE